MNNEPAFPSKVIDFHESSFQSRTVYQGEYQGMDLRDYFAAKAMQAFISEGAYNRAANDYPKTEDNDNRLSAASYRIADAMLKARVL